MLTGPEPITADELSAFEHAARRGFHDDAHPAEVEMDVRLMEPERALVVRDEGEIVGTAAALTQHVTVPGGKSLPVAAVSAVAVVPGHTRKGHLTRLMRTQLDTVPEPIAVLYASEGAIYGRYGYGLSTRGMTFELLLPGAAIRPSAPRPRERPRLHEVAEALPQMKAVYEAVRPSRPGLFERTPVWWERRTFDP
jgi:predicted acetyltransferase